MKAPGIRCQASGVRMPGAGSRVPGEGLVPDVPLLGGVRGGFAVARLPSNRFASTAKVTK